jgi:enterobactin synthetase component F
MRDVRSCPLSSAQQEVCLAISHSGSNLNYHLCDVIEFRGDLNLRQLEIAIRAQFLQTDALRTTFETDPRTGGFVQHIHASGTLPNKILETHDVGDRPDPEQAYSDLLDHLLQHDMHLQHGPLMRYVLIRLAEHHYRLIEMASHLVGDGFSHGILFSNITAHYNALCRGETVAPLELVPLASVFAAEEDYRHSERHNKDRSYWRQYCLKMPEPTQLVPGDAPLVKLNRLRKVFNGPTLLCNCAAWLASNQCVCRASCWRCAPLICIA